MLARLDQLGDDLLLELAELLLTVAEQIGDGARRAALDLAINVDERGALERGEQLADGGLAGTHEPDEDVGPTHAGDQGIRLT